MAFNDEINKTSSKKILILEMDKPVAELYIDDRGIGYRGSWLDVIRQVSILNNKN